MTPFGTESWLWYGITMVIVTLRFVSRILHFKSIRRFQVEDYLMIYLACAYTTFLVLINISTNTNTNLIDPKDIPYLTPEDIADRTFGSKVILGVESTMCMIQWGTKVCLLLLYYRLTENLTQNLFVKIVGAYVVTTYIVLMSLYLGYWCRPFHDYWQTPTDNVQCTTALHHLIMNLAFNLSSDILIMSIPLPLLIRAHLEIKRKILLCFPFTLGFFSIICAILSKYNSFRHPFSPIWTYWYTREASCVMIVSNMPYTWGLLRRLFKAKSFWERGSGEMQNGHDGFDPARDTGMRVIAGEMEEIDGLEITVSNTTARVGNHFGSKWKGFSAAANEKSSGHLTPEIVEITESTQGISPILSQSDASTKNEKWNDIEWKQEGITPIQTTDSLMPPSPAVIQSSFRHTNNVDHRRVSAPDSRHLSSFSSRRPRSSVSEASRRSARASVHVDAIDRLYRLEDEDLIADTEALRPRSHCSPHSGFS